MNEESIFAAALEAATEAERQAFLEKVCAGDTEMLQRLERLLAAHHQSSGILDHDPLPTLTTELARDAAAAGTQREDRSGSTVAGRYRLLREIGEGGMGEVYLAEQTEPVRRHVAVKLIKSGMSSKTVLARFAAERQALALMDHPHIAKVYDGGAAEDGRPFFVMEYVEGVPITQYCDDHRLGVAERLALLVPVCQAVQHAHSKGVIHRDLKPSNILIHLADGKPSPKVIDFGLAKATKESLTDQTLRTAHGSFLGTPLYMSPEQAGINDADVDTRADVYALGVVLYELLTGTTPLERRRFREAAWDEVLRVIREEEPPRPSARLRGSDALPSIAAQRGVEPARLARTVRGELDWIALKCLEKNRERRYETVDSLARDLQRYLEDESVEACPPSARYLLGKLVRRHRISILTAAVILLLLIGGIVGTTWGMIRAGLAWKAEAARAEGERRANERAQARLTEIEKGNEILASVFRDLDPVSEEKEGRPLRAILGDRLIQAADQLEQGGVGDALVSAQLQSRLGVSLLNLGAARRAVPLLEKAFATQTSGLGEGHEDTLVTANNLASAYQAAGRRDEAAQLFEKTCELRRASQGSDDPETLRSMHNLALWYHEDGDWNRAIRLYEETLGLKRARLGPDHPETLETMSGLGVSYQAASRWDEAIRLLEETLRLRRLSQGPGHLGTLNTMNNLAQAYKASGDLDRARPLMEEVLRLTRDKVGPDHPDTLVAMNNLAAGHRAANQLNLALPLFEETFKLRKARLGPDHADTLTSMNNLAECYRASGDLGRGLPLLEETLRLLKAKLPPGHPNLLGSMNNLAAGYRDAGQLDRAVPLLKETLTLMRAKLPADHPNTIIVMYNLASAYRLAGRLDQALPLFREAAAAIEKRKFDHPRTVQTLGDLARALEEQEQFGEAESWRRKLAAAVEKRAGPDSPAYATELADLGANLLRQEKWVDAESSLRQSLASREKASPDAWEAHATRTSLGTALLGQGKHAEAEPLLLQGYQGLKTLEGQIPPPERPRIAEAGGRIVQLYEAWGRPEKASEWRGRLQEPRVTEPKP